MGSVTAVRRATHLLSTNERLHRGCETEPNLVPADGQHGHPDGVTDDDPLHPACDSALTWFILLCISLLPAPRRLACQLVQCVNDLGEGKRFSEDPDGSYLQERFLRIKATGSRS